MLDDTLELRVHSGAQRGAALPLLEPRLSVGADPEQDLCLAESGLPPAAGHLVLDGGAWYWEACAQPGERLGPLGPEPFDIGGAWLSVAQPDTLWPVPVPVNLEAGPGAVPADGPSPAPGPASAQAQPARRAPNPRALLRGRRSVAWAVAGVALGLIGSSWGLSYSDLMRTPPAPPPSEQERAAALAAAVEQARVTLSRMLGERMLEGVEVAIVEGQLQLSGGVPISQGEVYRRMLERYKVLIPAVPVTDLVNQGGNLLPFTITQVVGGSQAHIVTAEGHRLYIGDSLAGFRLAAIEGQRIRFDGQRVLEVHW